MRQFKLVVSLFIVALIGTCAFTQTAVTGSEVTPTLNPGTYRTYTCTNPAAGVEITCTVPAGKAWRLISIRFTFTTSAAVANRTTTVAIDDSTNTFFEASAQSAQAASLTRTHIASATGYTGGTIDSRHNIPIPINTIIGPGYRIRTITALIDAADDYGLPVVFVEEWVR